METLKCILDLSKCLLCDDISMDKVAEFKKCVKCVNHVCWHIAFDGQEVDL